MDRVLWIAAGGATGSVLRYVVARWLAETARTDFPWGTFAVNVAGSFAMGVVMHLAAEARVLSETARLGLGVGLLGGFTTYSAFAWEAARMTGAREWGHALLYAAATVVACVAAVAAGTALSRALS